MKTRHVWMVMLGIFLLTFSLRMFFAFQTPGFSDDRSYYSLRQVESIVETGTPIYKDPLSFGGRTFIFTPLYYYILAFFNLFFGIGLVGKLIPNLIVSLSIIPVFLISRELSNTKIALFSTFISSFIPIVFIETVNKVNPYTAMVPMILFLIFFFIQISKGMKFQIYFVVFLLAAMLTHPSSAIFVLGLLIFFILMRLDRLKLKAEEIELTIFSAVFMVWFYFLIFKKAFLLYGLKIIWYNLPVSVIYSYFSGMDILKMVQLIGVVPFFYGVYIIYKYLFKEKNRNILLILSFILADGLLLWLKLFPFTTGLMFLGVFLTLLLSVYLKHFFMYLSKTRFSTFENLFIISLLIAFISTSFLPTVFLTSAEIKGGLSAAEIDAFIWLGNHTDPGAKILTSPNEGHLVTSISGRKNVIDSNYLFVPDIDTIFNDVETVYKTKFITQSVDLLGRYGVTYLYYSDRVLDFYGLENIKYLDQDSCFNQVYHNSDVHVYAVGCKLK